MRIIDTDLEAKRNAKEYDIKVRFTLEHMKGFMTSYGIKMDCKEGDITKLSTAVPWWYTGTEDITLRDFNNKTYTVNFDIFRGMVAELVRHQQSLREKKWTLQEQIKTADEEALKEIKW